MPIYDYKCKNCGKISEILQRTLTEKKISCPECDSKNMEKQLSAPGFIVKSQSIQSGTTCCGREERCDTPACSTGEACRREK